MIAQNNSHVNHRADRTAVRYDRERKTWLSINGHTEMHGSQREAMLAALRNDYPDLALAALVEELVDLSVPPTLPVDIQDSVADATLDRLLRGAQLLLADHVLSDGRVESQSDTGKFYQVREIGMPKAWHCDCPDHAHNNAPPTTYGGRMCKHVAATLIAYFGEFPVRCGDCDGLGYFPGIPGIEGECTCDRGTAYVPGPPEAGQFQLEDIPF